MTDRPSPIDTIESLNPDWGLVLFAVCFVVVGAWLVWKFGRKDE